MEIIIGLILLVGAGYFILRPKKTETVVEAVPYKVETPVETPAPVVEETPAPVVAEAPAKKPRAKKAPVAKKAPAAKKTATRKPKAK